MNLRSVALCAAFVLIGQLTYAASINEIRIDQSGADNDEFVELFGTAGESLSGTTFVILQDNGNIDGVVDLTGQSIGSNGYFVMAESTFSLGTADFTTTLNLENGENSSYLLVDGFTGMETDDLDTMDDGTLTMPWSSILSGVSILDDEDTILAGGPEDIDYSGVLGIPTVGPDGSFAPGHFFAVPDGSTTFSIGLFDPTDAAALDTPGAMNVPEPAGMALASVLFLGFLGIRRQR